MARNKFPVEVLTPEGKVFDDEVEMVSTRTTTGSIGVLANHAPLMAILEPTELRLYKSESEIVRFAQGEGYLQVVDNSALVLVEDAIAPDSIDRSAFESRLREARESMERAEEGSEERVRCEREVKRYEAFLKVWPLLAAGATRRRSAQTKSHSRRFARPCAGSPTGKASSTQEGGPCPIRWAVQVKRVIVPRAQAQEKAKEVAGQAQEKAQDARAEARKRLRDQVDQRSTQAGEQVSGTAEDVRSVAMELRSQGKDKPAQYAEQAAERVERAGDWLRDSDGDTILSDVEDFARRNPWAVSGRRPRARVRGLADAEGIERRALPLLALERLRDDAEPDDAAPGLHPDGLGRDRDGRPAGAERRARRASPASSPCRRLVRRRCGHDRAAGQRAP